MKNYIPILFFTISLTFNVQALSNLEKLSDSKYLTGKVPKKLYVPTRFIAVDSLDNVKIHFPYVRGVDPKKQSPSGFDITNLGSPKINTNSQNGSKRQFSYFFQGNSKSTAVLSIKDKPFLGRDSHTNMQREFLFFPRTFKPTLKVNGDKLVMGLPNGENIIFDKKTKEVIGGVLNESAIDYNKNRHARANPRLKYIGKGLSVTISQRGDSPKKEYVWGSRVGKKAKISFPSYKSKPCFISAGKIWNQTAKPGQDSSDFEFLFKNDSSFYKMISKECKWDYAKLMKLSKLTDKTTNGSQNCTGQRIKESLPVLPKKIIPAVENIIKQVP